MMFKMSCNEAQKTLHIPSFGLSAARLCNLGYSWVNLEITMIYSPSYCTLSLGSFCHNKVRSPDAFWM